MATTIDSDNLKLSNTRRGAKKVLALLIGVNVAIFVALRLVSAFTEPLTRSLVSSLTLPSGMAEAMSQPWCVVTYMFTQYDELHIILNMLWLCWFGLLLSDAGVRGRFILLTYLAGGMAAAAGYLLAGAPSGSFLVGSSGAVMAVVASAAVATPYTRIDLPFFRKVNLSTAAIAIMAISLACMTWSFGMSHIAHIAGAMAGGVAGLFLRLFWRRNNILKAGSRPSEMLYDAVMAKLKTSGYASLTPSERDILIEASSPAIFSQEK